MVRVLVFLAVVAALAFGVVWFSEQPGAVSVVWQGYRIETTPLVALVGACLLFAALLILIKLLRALLNGPVAVADVFRGRRQARGRAALARGLVAIGVGDTRTAGRAARDAQRLVSDDPLALIVRAQAAELNGAREEAEEAFRAMLAVPETRALGLRGLYASARRRGDDAGAMALADEALRTTPDAPWAGAALMDHQCAIGDWEGARATVERRLSARQIDRATAKRMRAVLLTAEAQARAETDADARVTLSYAVEANKLAPDLVPAAATAARLLAENGDIKKAMKTVEAAWQLQPHPDLAEVYLYVRSGDSARDRLKRAERLAGLVPGDAEGQLALARAALDARAFETARAALAPLAGIAPARRVCLMMAELEAREGVDEAAARGWLARALAAPRDPAWVADGVAQDAWAPVSPITGRLGAFVWTVPDDRTHVPSEARLSEALEGHAAPLALPEEENTGDTPPLADEAPRARPVRRPAIIAYQRPPDDPGIPEDGDEPHVAPVRRAVPYTGP